LHTARAPDPARLCAFNLGIQVVWGAILAVSLQARSAELGRGNGVGAYAAIAAGGALVATLVQLAAGPASDRLRQRSGNRLPFYSAGLALAVPSLAWFYLAATYAQLLAAFLLLEFAMNVAIGPYQAVIPDYVAPEKRGVASSWMAAYQAVGNAAGLIVAGFVHDLRVVAAALIASLAIAYAVTLAHLFQLDSRSRGAPAAREAVMTPSPPLRNALRGPLGALLLSRGLINLGFYTVLGFLLFFVRDSLGISGAATTTQTALIFLTFTLAAVPGAAVAARPTDRFDKRLAVAVSGASLTLALAALAWAPGLAAAYVAAGFAGAAWGAFVTADWALATAVLPPASMATAMGVWNVATTLPQVLAPLVAAPLVGAVGIRAAGLGPRAAVVLALLEIAAGTVAIRRLPRV
jgi:MFS family permease